MDNGSGSYRRFLLGDEQGLEELVAEYRAELVYYAYGYVKSYAVAEDVMLDTFAETVLHKNRYKDEDSFKAYLFRIAANKSIDYIRRRKRESPLDNANELADGCEIESELVKSERDAKILKAVNSLYVDYRSVLILVYYTGMTPERAAVAMKKSKKQTYNLLSRAKSSLKTLLEKEHIDEEL